MLTQRLTSKSGGIKYKPIYIMTDIIATFRDYSIENETKASHQIIFFKDSKTVIVKESAEDIINLLKKTNHEKL